MPTYINSSSTLSTSPPSRLLLLGKKPLAQLLHFRKTGVNWASHLKRPTAASLHVSVALAMLSSLQKPSSTAQPAKNSAPTSPTSSSSSNAPKLSRTAPTGVLQPTNSSLCRKNGNRSAQYPRSTATLYGPASPKLATTSSNKRTKPLLHSAA